MYSNNKIALLSLLLLLFRHPAIADPARSAPHKSVSQKNSVQPYPVPSSKKELQRRHEQATDLVLKAKQAYSEHPPQLERAISFYKESLKFDDDPFTRQRMAQMLRFAGHYAEAEVEYQKVRQFYKKHPEYIPSQRK